LKWVESLLCVKWSMMGLPESPCVKEWLRQLWRMGKWRSTDFIHGVGNRYLCMGFLSFVKELASEVERGGLQGDN
jgi:hypothetical protein